MAKVTFKVEGLKDLEESLGQFTTATSKNIARRTLSAAAQPIADDWSAGSKGSIAVDLDTGVRLTKRQRSLAGRAAKVSLGPDGPIFRGERRYDVEVYVGPSAKPGAKAPSPAGLFEEFGTVNQPPTGAGRAAWDRNKLGALDTIQSRFATEIEKAAQRAARKQARLIARNGG